MTKKEMPLIKRRDRVVPIAERVKALNKSLVVTTDNILTVVAKWFDRKRKEWILCVTGGARFLAKFFRKLESRPRRHHQNKVFRVAHAS